MTTLPATFGDAVEAQALTYARECVARAREGNFLGLGFAPLDPNAGRAILRRFIKCYALAHPFNMDEVVDCARAGWDDADTALRELIAEFAACREPAPAGLEGYNIRLVRPDYVPPPRPHGQKRAGNIMRDLTMIAIAWGIIERFGLKPTRFQFGRKRRASACSIVAIAMGFDEQAVEEVWKRYAPRVCPWLMAAKRNAEGNQ